MGIAESEETSGLPLPSDVAASGETTPDSLFDSLAAARQEIADRKTTFVTVPGYAEQGIALYIQYRLLPGEELAKIGKKVQNIKDRWDRNVTAAIDTLIVACEGLFYDPVGEGNDEDMVQLMIGDEPVQGFTMALAEKMHIPVSASSMTPARSIVRGLFGGNDLAVLTHSMRVQRWMGNTNLDVNEEFLAGEL